jgi:hypothetical protein
VGALTDSRFCSWFDRPLEDACGPIDFLLGRCRGKLISSPLSVG